MELEEEYWSKLMVFISYDVNSFGVKLDRTLSVCDQLSFAKLAVSDIAVVESSSKV